MNNASRIASRVFPAAIALAAATWVSAEPVPEAERTPVDVRRTTLLVRDIDRSLPLYRDALGLKVVYDELIGGGTSADGTPKPPTIRLVLLRANDTFIGALGLMQRLNVTHPPVKPLVRPQAGEVILVVNAKDLETRFAAIRATPGVTVATAPEPVEYPAPGGQGTIPVLFSAIYDPDGYFIEINQILGAPAGTEQAAR
jgi:catechol 2,3-dioxygenase-like lactoylglutathione lyase family enzyme